MRDHGGPARDGLRAVSAGDLDGVHRAGERLARPDPVVGLPEVGRAPLDGVRAGGRALAVAADRGSAAAALVGLSAHCAACHQALGVTPIAASSDGARAGDVAWTALAFESEDDWLRAVAQLAEAAPGLATLRPWADRRDAVGALLASDRL